MRALRQAGISRDAIEDAIHACAAFNVIDRIADAFEFRIPSAEEFSAGADSLLKRGYR